MKKALLFLLLGSALHAGAATSITTATVSGQWTMAGSPYNVYNDITIAPNTSLSIAPGVEVIFHGLYRINVQGVLRAVGTASQNIDFKINDTTGWYDDVTPSGGWRGIQYVNPSSTGPDTSALEYCNITDMKYGPGSVGYVTGCLFVEENRQLSIKNCEFSHNNARFGYARCIVLRGPQKMDNCSIHDNVAAIAIVSMMLNGPEINHSSIHHNHSMQTVASELYDPSAYQSVKILNCDVYQNTTTSQGAQLHINTGHAEIRGCKVHHNTNVDEGAIFCTGGQVEITGNLICNNQQIVGGTCGMLEGGGAMHLSSNSSTSTWDSTTYIVRNNVIVNNYSANGMGAGVYVWHARVWIMNNTIINNVGNGPYGVGIGLINMGSNAYIKNNILYNNDPLASSGPLPEVFILNADTVTFENNWMPRGFFQTVNMGPYYLTGDTTTNIIGTNPNLQSPTAAASAAESALTSNFALTALSLSCINKGTSVGTVPFSTDYAGNTRVFGGTIDIGAYEYQSATAHVNTLGTTAAHVLVYPNPTSGNINISLPAAAGTLNISDATGRIVTTLDVTTANMSVNTAGYAKGTYTVQWVSGNEPVQVQKIIVE